MNTLADKLYNMELGDIVNINKQKYIRVIGGWVLIFSDCGNFSTVFIPYNNEFQK